MQQIPAQIANQLRVQERQVVAAVDLPRKRISLSMKLDAKPAVRQSKSQAVVPHRGRDRAQTAMASAFARLRGG